MRNIFLNISGKTFKVDFLAKVDFNSQGPAKLTFVVFFRLTKGKQIDKNIELSGKNISIQLCLSTEKKQRVCMNLLSFKLPSAFKNHLDGFKQ